MNVHVRACLLAGVLSSTLANSGCGGGGSGNQPIAAQPVPAPTQTPNPVPTPVPTPNPAPSQTMPAELQEPFDTQSGYTQDIYVSSTAAMGGDGSIGAPYATLREALLNATPGTRVRVAAGTYAPAGNFSNLQGTALAPIAVQAEGQVIIDGGGTDMAMHLTDARYLVLDGFIVQNTFPHGINIDDGSSFDTPSEFVVLRNMHFRNVGNGGNNDCLKMSGVTDFHVSGSEFESCNAGEAIDMVGCHDGVITSSYFHDLPRNGVQTKGGSADVLIHGNRFADVAQRSVNAGGSTGAPFFRPINASHEGARIQIVANVVERSGNAPVAFVGCDTCVFANNTLIEPRAYIARILEENTAVGPGSDGYFINNLIVFNVAEINGFSFVNVGADTVPGSFTFGTNLWFALDQPGFSGPVYQGGVPPETDAVIQQDPLLADPQNADYHLTAGSPAIARARSVPRGVPADFDGDPYDNPASIGAFAAP